MPLRPTAPFTVPQDTTGLGVAGYSPDYYLNWVGSAGIDQIILDGTAVFPNASPAGTPINVDLVKPSTLHGEAIYAVNVFNPGASDITVTPYNRETWGVAQYVPIEGGQFTVPANSSKSVMLQGLFVGEASRLVFQNVAALGGGGGFTVNFRVRRP